MPAKYQSGMFYVFKNIITRESFTGKFQRGRFVAARASITGRTELSIANIESGRWVKA